MANGETTTGWDADQHLQLLTTLHWVATGLGGLAFLALSFAVSIPFLPIIALPFMALHAASAMGLQERASWGWTVSLVTAIVSIIIGGMIGIAFAVYALIALNNKDVKSIFHGDSA